MILKIFQFTRVKSDHKQGGIFISDPAREDKDRDEGKAGSCEA